MGKLPPDALSLDGVTELVLFGAVPRGAALETAVTDENVAAIRVRKGDARLLLCVGGEKTGAAFRDLSLRALEAKVEQWHLDGIELDIEPLSAISDAKLTEIVRGLARPRRLLTFVVMPREDEIARLAPFADVVDRVSLMGYVDRISPARERELVVALRKAGFAAEKIGIGIDAKTTERRERTSGAAGVLLWEAGALCTDAARPCAPAAFLTRRDK
jgi:hypothetical protein